MLMGESLGLGFFDFLGLETVFPVLLFPWQLQELHQQSAPYICGHAFGSAVDSAHRLLARGSA